MRCLQILIVSLLALTAVLVNCGPIDAQESRLEVRQEVGGTPSAPRLPSGLVVFCYYGVEFFYPMRGGAVTRTGFDCEETGQ